MKVKITDINIFLPDHKVSSSDLEKRINANGNFLPEGSIERMFGVSERRFADAQTQVSDLAANAAESLLRKHGKETIDCLIFASASGDLIEPATANIIQQKLGLTCPAFDVKNACNSFVNALQIASSFIASGVYQKILIVSGEKLSNSIRFDPPNEEDVKKRLASYSFGDAGSAVVVEATTNGSGIEYQKFKTVGKHWELCTIKGGGSMHPFEVERNYFEGKTSELAEVMIAEGGTFFQQCLKEADWKLEEIDHVITHQVSIRSFEALAQCCDLPIHKIVRICDVYGNTASTAIPLSLYIALQNGLLKKGDKVAVIGLAAGISLSIQLMTW